MDEQRLHDDFREFLKLLNESDVRYLLIGGYAVGYYGYPRATADIDIWVAVAPDNADKLVDVLTEFGMSVPILSAELFLRRNHIVRMGIPPVRIEILTNISGVDFDECYAARVTGDVDGQPVQLISKEHLVRNQLASGRHKDLDDVENLS